MLPIRRSGPPSVRHCMRNGILFVAEHQGPYRTLQALEAAAPSDIKISYVLAGSAAAIRSDEGGSFQTSSGFLGSVKAGVDRGITAVIRSTSETPGRINDEDRIASMCGRTGIPVFVVEDFPLNFRPIDGSPFDLVFVDSDETRERHRRLGLPAGRICVSGSPRYAKILKPFSDRPVPSPPTVLWAGQPDGEASLGTVKALLPALAACKARLLFRPHARDDKRFLPRYAELFRTYPFSVEDVTVPSGMASLYRRVDLVVTQYSSAALEAGCYGVPSAFVMLSRFGVASMTAFKGHTTLPWANSGAVFRVDNEAELSKALKIALFDRIQRRRAMERFEALVHFNADAPQRIWNEVSKRMPKPA